jgi:transcriptional regulator with XRE-family HTH domain
MPRPSTRVELPALRAKFQVLCAWQGWSLADLARHLNVSSSTLSEYQCGIDGHASKVANSLPREKLNRLAALLRSLSPQSPSLDEAMGAWRGPDAGCLLQWLGGGGTPRMAELLVEGRRRLLVQTQVVAQHQRAALADMEADDRPTTDRPVKVSHGVMGVRFMVMAQPGTRLFVACATEQGWHQLVPGRRHDGAVTSHLELIPAGTKPPVVFAPPLGRHRFVFIQASVPLLQARQPSLGLREPLGETDVAELQRRLADSPSATPWCWGEVLIDAE